MHILVGESNDEFCFVCVKFEAFLLVIQKELSNSYI
jgi:hypothetical protein